MASNWYCSFKDTPNSLTVGDTLSLLCSGETPIKFKEPLSLKFLDKKQDYSLVILETLKKEDYFLALKVSSYRTGDFKGSFYITDGKNQIQIDNLSFKTQSILTKKEVKPYGPYGPFRLKPDFWYVLSFGLSLTFLAVFALLFFYRFFKRNKFIQLVLNRKSYEKPSKFFAFNLRKEQSDLRESLKHLEMSFKVFLEDCLFIPAVNQSYKDIIKNLKRYQSAFYKKEGANIRQILNEFSSAKTNQIDKKAYFELKKLCQKLVFLIEESKDMK